MPAKQKKQLEWSRRSVNDLLEIEAYIARDNQAAADAVPVFGYLSSTRKCHFYFKNSSSTAAVSLKSVRTRQKIMKGTASRWENI